MNQNPTRVSLLAATTLGLLALAGCQRSEPAAAPAPAAVAAPAAKPATMVAVEDFNAGVAKAKAEGKAVLVDAWAPWCHTCLSMQNYVMNDPSLAPLADRVVLVELDTDKPENAFFLEKYSVNVWPTFYVIDPANGEVASSWPGAASVREFRGFVEDGLAGIEAKGSAQADPNSPLRRMMAAQAAQAARDYDKAAAAYASLVAENDKTWPRRNEALMGWLSSLDRAGKTQDCLQVGRAHLPEVQGAAVPADYASILLGCSEDEAAGTEGKAARAEVIARLRDLTSHPPADASADDRADAFNILSAALDDDGDKDGARKAQEGRLAVLEAAAAGIKDPIIAQTYDYARAQAYVALGRGDEAVAMLEAREKEMPNSYEPIARLAVALSKMDRLPESVVAFDRAIAKSYGPRQLLYMRQKSEVQGRMGDHKGQLQTLRAEVAGYEALAKGHANAKGLEDARKRLAEAEHGTGA